MSGVEDEYEVALTYILSHYRWAYHSHERFGLSLDDDFQLRLTSHQELPHLIIPGNHDAWYGWGVLTSLSQNTAVLNYTKLRSTYFPDSFPVERLLKANTPPIYVYGLDSAN